MNNSPINKPDFFESKLTPMHKQVEVRRWLEKFSEFFNDKYEHISRISITRKDIEEFINTQLDEPKEKEI